ncbi:CcoQ/FixQ family Cbb3-type cytochrome c oxidase assembly chaperone [Microvirga tunisiensis]|uniref:CcoQ/FixQ family Cbb3-type cytochrome c oxidase assembly chaperone n=2 Tax=Pannonibacter tanglangensis TaxID=2750084 RepID=A0ABW9ZNC8_9HYPH|nr:MULTISPECIES: cbb3-type cytochrome c oxidase subunit 3 [unclassified Pannonibacter]NBN64245.1 CcoQ/FixQ family Cbb3-type cytochrome c oxidase assembly chaperone [Pannonibacter sp. XCT-34]NBN78778.1 CcoQ/FixQ family Cbb3-type cytochrome c oxidase assembly chaperone [Pannonibacter sp. XCT-53]
MTETYTSLAGFAQTWGLLYFVLMFAVVIGYAAWPKNKQQFDDAAQIPFRED